jgi:hypothetical protein
LLIGKRKEDTMITRETAERIWNCYREIAVGEKLLADMEEQTIEDDHIKYAETLSDAFGRRRALQLGIPSGHDCHRLFDVEPDLAKSVIRAHLAKKEAEMVAANEQARIELTEK